MAKKVKSNTNTAKKEQVIEKEELEEVELDDEEYDDEDEKVVEKKEVKKEKEKMTSNKEEKITAREKSDMDLNKIISIATLVISALSLIISLVVLSKVSDLNGTAETEVDTELNEDGSYDADYDTSSFKEIDVEEFIDLIKKDNGKTFIYTGRETCSYCNKMIGNLIQSVKDYDYTLYYLDTSNITSDEASEIQELDDILSEDFPATPMVYLVGDGKVIDVNEGYTNYSTYTAFLDDNGVETK